MKMNKMYYNLVEGMCGDVACVSVCERVFQQRFILIAHSIFRLSIKPKDFSVIVKYLSICDR